MSGGTKTMAWLVCLTFLLCVLHMVKGATKPCTLTEIVNQGNQVIFKTGQSSTKTFKLETINQQTTLKIYDSSGEVSQLESCDVIQKNDQPAEVVMSFRITGAGTNRYCWKGILKNYALFYVEGPKQSTPTSLTTEQCLSQLSATTSYKTMMKEPLPDNNVAVPNFGVSITSVIQPGTYKLSYAFDNQNQNCMTSGLTQSYVLVESDGVTFSPCGTTTTSYRTPFKKKLYVAGYVEDTMLDIIEDSGRVDGSFVVLVYHEIGKPFRYYLMRSFQAVIANVQQNYLEIFGVTEETYAYSPTGYVALRYVPSGIINDVLTLRAYSETCNSNPCQNGGTCVNQWLAFSCSCPAGFAGDRCEISDDECSRNDKNGSLCSYHGTCVPTLSSYTCQCYDGYTGPKCEDTTTCRSDTCKNGGTCYDPKMKSLAICECPPGYFGIHCEDTKACKTQQPCQNGGTCFDGKSGDYSCLCPDGYSGTNCAGSVIGTPAPLICVEGIDDICQNGGVCSDGKCVCQAFYTGRYCDDINEWFIGSVVLIVLLAVVMVVTLIVCCFFCARGTTLAANGTEKSYDPFTAGSQDVARSTSGYGPSGFIANQYPDPSYYDNGYTSKF